MKEKNTQKKIERLLYEMNVKSLSRSIGERSAESKLHLMLDGIEQRCTAEQRRYQRMLTVRQMTINTLSCIVILLCIYYLIPHNGQYTFVFDDHLTNHSETISQIDRLFAK